MRREFALPGTRPRYAPDRIVDVEHLKIDIRIDVERRRIEGAATLTVSPIQDGVRHVELDAVEMEIGDVLLEGTYPLEHAYDGKKLRIDLGGGRRAGEKLRIVVHYAASPRRGLYFIGPDEGYPERPWQVWTQGQDEDSRYWFPCFDSPHEKATTEVRATVPERWFALSNGRLLAVNQVGAGQKAYHWAFDTPQSCYLVTLVAGEFSEIRDAWEGIDVLYYVTPGREADARRALGRTPEMLALFSDRFGLKYPYDKYAQVFVAEFIFGGMENTTATTLTDAALFDERAAQDHDVEALVAHELAHHWFGDLLTCRQWSDGWLNEGFATYAEYVWREHAHGRDEAYLELDSWAEQYFGEDEKRYRRPVATNLYDEPIDLFDHHLYEKGGLVLHMLRRLCGDAAFWQAIGHYVRKHRGASVETRDFARAVEEATGRNLDWFFDQWIHQAGHPELEVEYAWDAAAQRVRLTVKQRQKPTDRTPVFRIPTEVRFRVEGRDVTLPLEIKESEEVFFFPLAAEPTQAIFDPGQHLLKKIEMKKPIPLWIAELGSASEGADRIAAARALAQQPTTQAIAALRQALEGDRFWGVRAAAASALGQHRTRAARDVLLASLERASHPKARRAIVRALGEYRGDETAAAALERIVVGGDASYFVEAEACLSLGKTRSPRAPAALRKALERESYLDVVRQHAYRGLAEARDESAIPLLLDGTRYGRVSHGRRGAILALAELVAGRQDREARDVRERIEELTADRDFRVQQAAIEALGVIGDARAISVLRRVVERELDGRLRRRAREVIRDLEEGRGRDEQVKSLRDDLEKLRKDYLELRERLLKLEESAPAAPTNPAHRTAPKSGAKAPTSRRPARLRAAAETRRPEKPAHRRGAPRRK